MSSIQCYRVTDPRDTLPLTALDELFIESVGQSLSETVFVYPCSIYFIMEPEGTRYIASATLSPNLSLLPGIYQEKGIYLFNVCTHPSYQHQGYMTHLLKRIIKEDSIYLCVKPDNNVAKDLYLKLGFTYLNTMPNGNELMMYLKEE